MGTSKETRPILVGALLALLSSLGGCSRHTSSLDPKTSFQVQLNSEPVSLDPALAEDGLSLRVLANVMEGLVGYDGAGQLKNRMAESYQVAPDGKRYVFRLRPKIVWSDGQPVKASDFVAALRRALDPGTPSKLAGLLFPIHKAREFHAGKAKAEDLGVRDDQGNVVIELDQPAPYFIQVMALSIALPEREDILKQNGGVWPESAPVTGPYRIVAHQPDQFLLLEPNPKYWDSKVERTPVILRIVRDEATAVSLLEQGQLDIVSKFPSFDVERLKKKGLVHTDPMVATYYLSFNTRLKPFSDPQWRRAVAGAINREEIVAALGTGETPARSWIPKGLEGFYPFQNTALIYSDSVKLIKPLAKNLKVSAGFDTSGRNTMVMEKIQADLLKNLGLSITLSQYDWKTYIKTLETAAPPIFRFARLAPFMDPISHLQAFTTGDPNNYSGWGSAEYDELFKQISTLGPGPEREKRIRSAEQILIDRDAVLVPLYHYVQTHAVSERVQGFRVNPFGVIRFDELKLKR